ncbi:MAG: hypothetical protein DRJ69_04565 [Thermoprotei archaeon]|nr:MAG: hypothetical protein DRJ69_04565 [Thermoprotei archaeon]
MEDELNSLILEAIEEALQKLTSSVRHVTLYYAEKKFNLPKEEIPKKPERFEEVLRHIYGSAANYVVAVINDNIFSKLGLTPKKRHTSLKEAIAKAKMQWVKRKK